VDRLGSVRGNGNGAIAYYPWGEERTSTPDGADKFATYFRDSSVAGVGEDYANARYYNNNFGRFWSVDPTTGDIRLSNPQTWNAYAYANGDPVNSYDPGGDVTIIYDDPCDMNPFLPWCPSGPGLSGPGTGPILLCTEFATMQPRYGCGGGGGGGGGVSFTASMSTQAANAIKNMSQGCQNALGQKWNLYNGTTSLLSKVNSANPNADVFYNGTLAAVANEPMSYWGYTGDSTLTGAVLSSSYGFTGANSNQSPNNQVVLGQLFFDENAAGQAETLLHEVLHTYTGLDDQQLGAALGIPASLLTDVDTASGAIHTYLTDGCNMTALKQAYGLN
jgi:RHS repeat-associated protein